jgi:molecular chaperone Hsp33
MDSLLRGTGGDHSVRVLTAITTDLVREACRRQGVQGIEAIVLGRAATAGCLLSTMAKGDQERVRIQLDGGGPVGRVIVDSRSNGRIRACFERPDEGQGIEHLEVDDGRATVGDAVGRAGLLVVTRDLGLESQYQGTVSVTSGEVDTDLEHYLERSEQLPSALTCAVVLDARGDVLRAGGALCQSLPDGDPASIDAVRETFAHGTLRALLNKERSPEELAAYALQGAPVETMGTRSLVYHCPCGEGTALKVLSTLGADDLEKLADEQDETEVRCHFCGSAYRVEASRLRELAVVIRRGQS